MHTVNITPSILPRLRTHTTPPQPLPEPIVPWTVRNPLAADPAVFHQPIVLALAPPRCAFEPMRWPVAQGLQTLLDMGVGYAAATAALVCLALGQTALATAYVDNHAYHVVVAIALTSYVMSLGITAAMLVAVSRV